MPQVTNFPGSGIRLSRGCFIFCGTGDPNASTQPDVGGANVGSIFLRQDGPDASHVLYVCTTSGTPATNTSSATTSVWTPK